MTSFVVEAHVDRSLHPEWAGEPQCVFCSILQKKLPAYTLYEDERVIAVLGWSPLVIPKIHQKHISALPEEYAAALGLVITRVAKALTKGPNILNRRQAVPHVGVRPSSAGRRRFSHFLFPRFTTISSPHPSWTSRWIGVNTRHFTLRLRGRCTRWDGKGERNLMKILPKNSQIRYDANCHRPC